MLIVITFIGMQFYVLNLIIKVGAFHPPYFSSDSTHFKKRVNKLRAIEDVRMEIPWLMFVVF